MMDKEDSMERGHGRGSSENMTSFEITDVTLDQFKSSTSSPSSFITTEPGIEFTYVVKDENQLLEPKQADSELQMTALSTMDTSTNPFMNAQELHSQSSRAGMMQIEGEGYDPNRIPASIFASKPKTPTEWSVASNESLFSIHMGNSSFSREHFLMMYKSGELARLDDSGNVPTKLQTVIEADNMDIGRGSEATESEMEDDTAKDDPLFSADMAKKVPDVADKNSAQGKVSFEEVRNSNSSIISFQHLLTDADKGTNPAMNVVIKNRIPVRHLQQEPQPNAPLTTPKEKKKRRFICFSFCSIRSSYPQ